MPSSRTNRTGENLRLVDDSFNYLNFLLTPGPLALPFALVAVAIAAIVLGSLDLRTAAYVFLGGYAVGLVGQLLVARDINRLFP